MIKKSRVVWTLVAASVATGMLTLPLAAQVHRVTGARTPTRRPTVPTRPTATISRNPRSLTMWKASLEVSTNNGLTWSNSASASWANPCAVGAPAGCGQHAPAIEVRLRWQDDPAKHETAVVNGQPAYYRIFPTRVTPSGYAGPSRCNNPNDIGMATSARYTEGAHPDLAAGQTLVCTYYVQVWEPNTSGSGLHTIATNTVTVNVHVTDGSKH
jgi:hypothetical protein